MTRVVIADDHPLVREGYRRLLATQPDVEVVGEAGAADEVLEVVRSERPDVLLLDISMPGGGFEDTMRWLRAVDERVRVLVISVHDSEDWGLPALRFGAAGYVSKRRSVGELLQAIRTVVRGDAFLPSNVCRLIAQPDTGPSHLRLSQREFEVLRMIGTGLAVKETAHALGLSPKTVSTYRGRIMDKLGLLTNAELVRYVHKHGLADDD